MEYKFYKSVREFNQGEYDSVCKPRKLGKRLSG